MSRHGSRLGTFVVLSLMVAFVLRDARDRTFTGCHCGDMHGRQVQMNAVKEAPAIEEPTVENTREAQLLREVTNNTPGLARSTSPKEGQESGGIRLLFPPEPHESVTFALWFGPLPCFQVGTFRYCFCLSQTMVLSGFLLALAVAIMGPEILMAPNRR
eukprot:symbB.v1.2.016397.t1/scaffold1247.1/size129121/5